MVSRVAAIIAPRRIVCDVGLLHDGGIKKATDGICVSFFKKTVA
jgi:hypothetical protein